MAKGSCQHRVIEHVCRHCGEPWVINTGNAMYCKKVACQDAMIERLNRKARERQRASGKSRALKCENCGLVFYARGSRARFCFRPPCREKQIEAEKEYQREYHRNRRKLIKEGLIECQEIRRKKPPDLSDERPNGYYCLRCQRLGHTKELCDTYLDGVRIAIRRFNCDKCLGLMAAIHHEPTAVLHYRIGY